MTTYAAGLRVSEVCALQLTDIESAPDRMCIKVRQIRHDAAKSDTAWRNLFAALRRHDWVVYAKQPLGGPAQVLEYLGRYFASPNALLHDGWLTSKPAALQSP
jgi:hypothetical protein